LLPAATAGVASAGPAVARKVWLRTRGKTTPTGGPGRTAGEPRDHKFRSVPAASPARTAGPAERRPDRGEADPRPRGGYRFPPLSLLSRGPRCCGKVRHSTRALTGAPSSPWSLEIGAIVANE